MNIENLYKKLEQVIILAEKGILPTTAKEWGQSALNNTDAIQETVDSMQANGVEAPTVAQSRAFENIYQAALRWIGDHPEVYSAKETAKEFRREHKKPTPEEDNKGKHWEYLNKRSFTKHNKYICFSGTESEVLQRYGYWLEALQMEQISPITEGQRQFLSAVHRKAEPITKHERLWLKYMYAVEMSETLFTSARTLQEMKAKDAKIKYADILAAYKSAADIGSLPAKMWLDEQKSPWIKPNSIWRRADGFSGGQVNNLYVDEINRRDEEPF
jgi:uncharacterized protein YifE (UPF0438 family)